MEKQTLSFSYSLPFFSGFYESPYEYSDLYYDLFNEEVDGANEEYNTDRFTVNMFDADYDTRRNDIVNCFVDKIKYYMPEFVTSVELEYLDSPKYYNYRTDEIIAKFTLDSGWDDAMKKFMEENKDWLTDRIHKDWTSYDGFMSFMENNIDKWYDMIFIENDDRYLSEMIKYMMLIDNPNVSEDIMYDVLENIYDYEYIIHTEEYDKLVEELNNQPEKIIMPKEQLEIPFE